MERDNRNGERIKYMKLGKYILRAVLFLLAAVIAGAAIYLYPAWKAAKTLQDKMSLPYSSFEGEIELDREKLPEEQRKLFGTLAKLTGIREDALYRLSIEGSMIGDKVHLLIYPQGNREPLFEFYLSNDMNVINEAMLYNVIRSSLTERFGLLEYLMPVQEEPQYMTFGQLEQLFGVDLSGFTDRIPFGKGKRVDAKEYFLMLAVMSREERADGYGFSLKAGQTEIGFDVPREGDNRPAGLRLQIQNLPEALEKGGKALSFLENRMPFLNGGDLQAVKGFSLVLTKEAEGSITIPTSLVSQEIIETIAGIRAWVQETFGIL